MAGGAVAGNMFKSDKMATAAFMSIGTNVAGQMRRYEIMQRNMQGLGLSMEQAMQLGEVANWNVATMEGFNALRKGGFVDPKHNFSTQLDLLQKYAPNVKQVDMDTTAISVGGTTFYTKGGRFVPVETSLGQLNLKGAVNQSLEKDIQAREGVGLSEDWEKMKRFSIANASTTGVDKTTVEEFQRQVRLNTVKQFGTNNAFKESIKSESEQMVLTELSVGADVHFVKAKAGYQARVRTSQGLEKTYEVSEEFKKAYEQAVQNAFRETFSQFARDEHRVQALKDWAEKSNATEVKEYIEQLRFKESYQSASENQENVQFVHYVAQSLGMDSDSPQVFNMVAAKIREYAASDKSEDKEVLQNMIDGYKNYRIYNFKIQEGVDSIQSKKQEIYNEVKEHAKETSSMASKEAPKGVTSLSVQRVDPTTFNSELKSVQTGLENQKELAKYTLLPGVGPVIAGVGNYLYYLHSNYGMLNNVKWDTRGGNIFQTPKEIVSNPQKPLEINMTRDVAPVPFTSPEETKYRGEKLDAMLKAKFGSKK